MASPTGAPEKAGAPAESTQFVHPSAGHAKKKKQSIYTVDVIKAFYVFLVANLIAAAYAPIQDCDETFNYWEPTHYLSHGYGLQTWEYSPEFSIRSWLYVALHAIVGNFRRLLPRPNKLAEFYFVRYGLAFVCALCQTLLYRSVTLTLNGRISLFYMIATVASPGNFHASAAYLPSSFAMYACMLGAAAFMNWRGGLKTSLGIFWFAFGGVLGWPFAAALSIPFLLEEAVLAVLGDKEALIEAIMRVTRGFVAGLIVMFFDFLINLFFYKQRVIVSWNIVKYNIFSSTGGPDLYGTEPWHFYFKNLALNFNIWFVLALLALPLFFLQKLVAPSGQGFQTGMRTVVFVTPFYMWLAIFTLQPHKEERFMYPAYPFLALNAAMSLHLVLSAIGSTDPKTLMGKIPARLKFMGVALVMFLSFDLSLARVFGLWDAYAAPLTIYKPLWEGPEGGEPLGGPGDTVCYGKEWYRFPSSYFLPRDMHAKFVRSEFRGLLPGEFSEARTGFGFWSGTWLPPSGLNDRNEEDPSKYVELRTCSFLVDTQYPERTGPVSPLEPDYVSQRDSWDVVRCKRFLDAEKTHILARVMWVPGWSIVPAKFRRHWGQHCLLKKKTSDQGMWIDPGEMMMG